MADCGDYMRTFKELLIKNGPVTGTWSQISSPDVIEILGRSGFDFTIIDMEHTAFGFSTVESLIRTCHIVNMTPIVRVRKNDRVDISRALDIGAAAVVVPGIRSANDAKAAIDATRFEPNGTRGACPFIRAGGHFVSDWSTYTQRMEAEPCAILLIETREAASDIESIAALPGIGCILAGPFDLSVSLGRKGDYLHPDVQSTIEHIVQVANREGVPIMMPIFMPETAEARRHLEYWMDRGVRLFTVGGDKILLLDYCTRYLRALKSG